MLEGIGRRVCYRIYSAVTKDFLFRKVSEICKLVVCIWLLGFSLRKQSQNLEFGDNLEGKDLCLTNKYGR